MAQDFSAKIYKLGINPCVDVPQQVSEAFEKRGYIPVQGTLNDHPIRATLVPKGSGQYRLYINGEMRKRAKVEVGDQIHLVLETDDQPRTIPMPEDFSQALEKNKQAKAAFVRLLPSRQKDILLYLNALKRPETLKRNIERAIAALLKDSEGDEQR